MMSVNWLLSSKDAAFPRSYDCALFRSFFVIIKVIKVAAHVTNLDNRVNYVLRFTEIPVFKSQV
jgi:hypothetical protein